MKNYIKQKSHLAMGFSRTKAVILLGPPGSGKTTLAYRFDSPLAEVVETGELLRSEIEDETPLASKLKSFLDSGQLAPTDIVVEVVDHFIKQVSDDVYVLVFDGFPRRKDEIKPFFELCESRNIEFSAALVFDISRRTAVKRLTGRRICPNCQKVYNVYFGAPSKTNICDVCGHQLRHRSDDKPEVVEERLEEYYQRTTAVIEHFKSRYAQNTHVISAEGSADEVWKNVFSYLRQNEGDFDEVLDSVSESASRQL
jgi:adenylate kinase